MLQASTGDCKRKMSTLPEVDEEQVATLRSEYEKLMKDGGESASEACFRCLSPVPKYLQGL